MVGSLVVALSIVVLAGGLWLRSAWRRRSDSRPFITTWPDIELSQRYGGWDADAYDAGTGRDHLPLSVPEPPSGGPWSTPPGKTR
jgi:hypothetical protein